MKIILTQNTLLYLGTTIARDQVMPFISSNIFYFIAPNLQTVHEDCFSNFKSLSYIYAPNLTVVESQGF